MNKCYKCGREFEGQFCPDCGTKYEAEKTCPDCGATLDGGVNFCNHCGHRFTEDAPSPKARKENNFVEKVKTFFVNTFNSTKTWIVNHKKQSIGILAGTASLVLVCVLVFALIIPLATNIYSARKLSKINLGDSQEQVVKIIGEPYDKSKGYKWEYFGDELLSLIKEQEELDKKAESITSESQFEKLAKQQEELDKKFEKTKGKHIEVIFSGQNAVVSEVRYDAAYQITDASLSQPTVTAAKKEPKLVTVDDKNVLNVEHIQESKIPVRVEYTDGSFSMAALPYNAEKSFGNIVGNSIFPSSVTLSWSDRWGTYSQSAQLDPNYKVEYRTKHVGYHNRYDEHWVIDYNIPTQTVMDFFEIEAPWKDKGELYFGANVTYIPDLAEIVSDVSKLSSFNVIEFNKNYCSDSGIIIDSNDNIVCNLHGYEITQDNNGNTFAKIISSYSDTALMLISASSGDELVLPYYNNGNYRVIRKVARKYKTCRFDESERWTEIPSMFLEGSSIESIVIPNGVTSIGDYAFFESSLKNVTIPDGVTRIGYGSFFFCGALESITIPISVTSIGYQAFSDCRNLNIYYLGTIEQWNEISLNGGWSFSAETVICRDGEVEL